MNALLSLATAGIDVSFHEPYASLMKGLVYGIPVTIDPTLKQDIIKSGLAHLVVLSGANVTLLTEWSEKIFFSLNKKVGIVLQILFLGLFVSMVGPQAPLIRAVCMFLCTTICILSGRPSYIGWNLFLTIVFIAIAKPQWIYSISFHLSVAATMGIIAWGHISERLPKKIPSLIETFLESWVVFCFTLPVTMMYFKSISLMSPFSTALVSWLIVPLMLAGFAISIVSSIVPQLSTLIAIPTQTGLQFIIWIIHQSASISWGYVLLK